jgi:hypothetical protein
MMSIRKGAGHVRAEVRVVLLSKPREEGYRKRRLAF